MFTGLEHTSCFFAGQGGSSSQARLTQQSISCGCTWRWHLQSSCSDHTAAVAALQVLGRHAKLHKGHMSRHVLHPVCWCHCGACLLHASAHGKAVSWPAAGLLLVSPPDTRAGEPHNLMPCILTSPLTQGRTVKLACMASPASSNRQGHTPHMAQVQQCTAVAHPAPWRVPLNSRLKSKEGQMASTSTSPSIPNADMSDTEASRAFNSL